MPQARSGPQLAVQRVAVDWSRATRGACDAEKRSRLPDMFALPEVPPGAAAVRHDVVMSEVRGYRPQSTFGAEPDDVLRHRVMPRLGLRFTVDGDRLLARRVPVGDAFPRRRPVLMFALAPGELGRYRVNFRFTSFSHESDWRYGQWTLTVGFRAAPAEFAVRPPAADVDDRVSLYGNGTVRRRARGERS